MYGVPGNGERLERLDPLIGSSGIPGVVYDPWIKKLGQWKLELDLPAAEQLEVEKSGLASVRQVPKLDNRQRAN